MSVTKKLTIIVSAPVILPFVAIGAVLLLVSLALRIAIIMPLCFGMMAVAKIIGEDPDDVFDWFDPWILWPID